MHSITVGNVTVGFNLTSYSTSEDGSPSVEVCAQISNLQGDLECNLVVTFNPVSNNKSGKVIVIFDHRCDVVSSKYILRCTVDGEDFTVAPPGVFEATFVALSASNGNRACDNITIIDDNALEGEHSFEIQIVSTDPLLSTISPASTVVTIQDNEGIY